MRVTDKLVFDSAIRDTARARERAEAAQRAASTGSRVDRASDDPAAAGMMTALQLSAARLDAISRAAGLTSAELQATDAALEGVGNAVARARELAVQFAGSGYPAAQMASGGEEAARLVEEIIARGNTRFGNRWIFAGNLDGAPAFSAAGAFQGDDAVRQAEVAPGVRQDAAVNGNAALKGSQGGVDVIATVQQLAAALAAGDPTAVQGTLDALDQATTQVASARAAAGVAMNAFDEATAVARTASGDDATRAAQLGEVDIAQSAIELATAQRALEASYSAAAQGFKLTILDFLR